jgi:hypothetical protein
MYRRPPHETFILVKERVGDQGLDKALGVKSGTGADFPFPQARREALATTNQGKGKTLNAIAERR